MDITALTRRRMLQVGGGGVAASLAVMAGGPAFAQPRGVSVEGQPMPEGVTFPDTPPRPRRADSVGIAVVGLGDFALNQMMPRFDQAERVHVAALVSGNRDKLRRVGDAYGVPPGSRYTYDTFDQIAQDDGVDAVYIVLPSGLHAQWTERAFAAGKHVLCEKPMALNPADCERMIAASRRANRKLMIAYRVHFEPHNVRAMELMREGAVGDLRALRAEQANLFERTTPSDNWRLNSALAGESPLEDLGIYGLQAALYLSGEMPESVSAQSFRPTDDPRFSQIAASMSSQLRFPSGAIAQLATSYDSLGNNFVDARGTKGAILLDPATSYSGQTLKVESGEGKPPRMLTPGDPERQFAGELDHFANSIRDDSKIIVPAEMGLRDVRLITAINLSARERRTVRLNPDGTMRG